jgi:hypothetical protein
MSDFFCGIVLVVLLMGIYALVISFHKRSTVDLTVHVFDLFTEVFDSWGNSLVKTPNKILYTLQKGKPQILAFGQGLSETTLTQQEKKGDLQELDLITDQEATSKRFDGVWGAFIPFCCMKACRALGKRWSPLKVKVVASTSNTLVNQKLRKEIGHKSLRFFGEFQSASLHK